jgi:hypothetical protein
MSLLATAKLEGLSVKKGLTTFELKSSKNLSVYRRLVTINRKVRINSLRGLEDLNKLYIPTYSDMDYTYELVHVYAKTVKSNGEEIVVEPESMQETTLPGNLVSLYGFEGNVLQFAFENVQVGDVIEYNYTMRYEVTKYYGYWNISSELQVSGEYPILEGEYVFKIGKGSNGMFAMSNTDEELTYTDDNYSYRVKLKNVAPIVDEEYAVENQSSIRINYKVSNSPGSYYGNWNDYFDWTLGRTKGKEYFFGGIRIRDIVKKANAIETGNVDKVNAIIDYLEDTYKSDPYAVYSFNKSYAVDMVDLKNLNQLFKEIHLDAKVIFVRDKSSGEFIYDFYTISQFNSMLVVFKDKNGKDRYWEPFEPFRRVDDISYEYQGTNGLMLERLKKGINIEKISVPVLNGENNATSRVVDINMTRSKSSLLFEVVEKVKLKGENATDSYLGYYLEHIDSSLTYYSDYKIEEYLYRYPNCKVDTIMLDSLNDSLHVGYEIRYSFTTPFSSKYDQIIIDVQDIVGRIVFSEVKRERLSNAVFDYPFEIHNVMTIHTKAESILKNDFLNRDFSNEVADFSCVSDVSSSKIELKINYALKAKELSPNEWLKYVDAMDEIFSFYNQKIRINY